MYRGYLYRKKETQARAGHQLQANTPNGPASQASSSPTASLSTSPLPSVAHATSPSISSQADTPSADHSVSIPAPSTSPKNRFLPVSIAPGPRPTTPAPMGQTNSSIDPLPHSPVFQSFPLAEPASPPPSNPLKRIWGNRRKKSEDVTAVFAASHDSSPSKGKARAHDVSASSSLLSTPAASVDDLQVQNDVDVARSPSFTKRLLQLQISPKKLPQVPKALKPGGPSPIPPPKNDEQQVRKEPSRSRLRVEAVLPSTIAAPNASTSVPQLAQSQGSSLSPGLRDKTDAELKQDWRKSDSTVMSYVTIRPGALTSGRSTRPVSLAESSHSGHTVVPVNKRFSALITDAEFAMLEERDSDSEEDVIPITFNAHSSPTSSVKARNRRSASFNFGPGYPLKAFEAPALSGSVSAMPRLSRTLTDTPVLRDVPPTAPATTVTPPTGTKQWTVTTPAQSAKVSSRSQLAAWSTPTSDRAAPVQQQTRRPTAPNQIRQPKVSISGGGFAPVAFGFGRRAAEKVQRVWEGLSSSSAQSTHSASSSSISDSNRSATRQSLYGLQSSLPGAWKHQRRTPNGPSGSWSISSSIASAESDSFATPTGPTLGPRLRGPKRNAAGTAVIGGMVFGRELRKCVKETAIDDVRAKLDDNEGPIEMGDLEYVRPIEQRLLPAIVVRCYQHLQRWGLQEEGLFRINGRASHVAKLRSEFDTGADYELAKSDPGDLDPHAVSSIFKAYLRELPESLLTDALMPMFESSLPKNDNTAQSVAPRLGLGLRKPPSLSTLAMPSFAVQRTVSNETTRAISSLIAQLPIENRDLLYTVVELINATAAASKETKMPLGNLLLLFCPSLGISHALLRMLCEAKDIWTAPAKDDTQAAPLPEVTSMSRTPSSCPIVNGYPSSFSTTDSESDLSSLPAARPRNGKRRGPIATMVESPGLSMYRSSSGSAQDDAASYMSALDGSPSDSNSSITNLPALSTSTDSLATPSTMSEVSSLQQSAAPYHASEPNKDAPSTVSSDEHDVDLSLPEPRRRPLISPPVPFPSSGEGSPRTPLSPRKSLALLSFPPLNKSDANTPGSSATWAHRPKRPSLTLLFSKKSMSSLKSSPSQPRKDSCSTPVEPVCIRPTTPAVPPVLDTTISSSPIHLFDFAETKLAEPVKPEAPTGDRLSAKDSDWQGRERNDSSPGSSLFSTPHSTPQQTPIADYFRARSKSVLSLNDEKDAKTPAEASNVYPARPSPLASSSQLSLTPSLDVGIASALEEDWAQSVLDEAQASSSAKSRWRVSKLF